MIWNYSITSSIPNKKHHDLRPATLIVLPGLICFARSRLRSDSLGGRIGETLIWPDSSGSLYIARPYAVIIGGDVGRISIDFAMIPYNCDSGQNP